MANFDDIVSKIDAINAGIVTIGDKLEAAIAEVLAGGLSADQEEIVNTKLGGLLDEVRALAGETPQIPATPVDPTSPEEETPA